MPADPKASSKQETAQHRSRPADMPSHAPSQKGAVLRGTEKPKDILPEQKPLTDDEPVVQSPKKWKLVLVRVLTGLLLVIALVFMYVFLLLGEPDEDAAYTQEVQEQQIQMPMTAIESLGENDVSNLAVTFGQPVLCLYGSSLSMELARTYDTAFGGGYARRVTLTYAFSDGTRLLLESIRPTAAVTLLQGSDYVLDADSLYAIGGVDAARMDNDMQICVFGQTGEAVYAVVCPQSHAAELEALLKQTTLTAAVNP